MLSLLLCIFSFSPAASRIPVKTSLTKSEPNPVQGRNIFFKNIICHNHCFGNKSVLVFFVESKPTPRDTSTQSRIPVLTGESQSPSPTKKPSVTGTSPTTSQQSTPTKRKLPTPGGVGQVAKEAPQVRTVPSVTTEDHDSEVCYILTLFTDCCKFLLMLVWRIRFYIESCYLSIWHLFILFISFILHNLT